jgi:hypothetical protein
MIEQTASPVIATAVAAPAGTILRGSVFPSTFANSASCLCFDLALAPMARVAGMAAQKTHILNLHSLISPEIDYIIYPITRQSGSLEISKEWCRNWGL